jgi:hypothetical protein
MDCFAFSDSATCFITFSNNEKETTIEARLDSFLVEHDIPYSVTNNLMKFVKRLPWLSLLSHASLVRIKATNIAQQALASHFHQKLLVNLKTNLL